jgi:light-independent protochlorophyllide reductase subunit B
MGLEEHLLQMFREDFEFGDLNASHLAAETPTRAAEIVRDAGAESAVAAAVDAVAHHADWTADATQELKKIPFFVRGKARNNTETYARERGLSEITIETLYDAKAHFGR